ncbi:efflux transporter outer membrane subunit [Pseudomonas sichuanensis]|uniref:efflux transporter outer membrane subunit n=1 Tax=Pseudomonas sichuanensis TaxID=2213015 RepID=UPI00244A9901|nr:efflux transporter outer membrane subunit [Pseudomonas sichuanensis]MDH0732052.1 efflux transporter outer membrane subunit [Pseudomonas sichuanensis]MDH1584864.1 efflux transporter outer membrane subunit [Pseudomonas sichuanensis]MDH1593459.1 efflux transporter outer membrane subunit [Pseudomonas sichuanensis]MDH1599158.1 efflux transporter outer membrane subunit [Pseudomonas sichuanensis]
MLRHTLTLCAALVCGCSLAPDYQRPSAPVAEQFPQGPAYQGNALARRPVEDWRQVFHDPVLRQLIDNALANNRDLRTAALNVEAYRAQYRIQRADLFPKVTADAQGKRQYLPRGMTGTDQGIISSTYATTLGISAYELDLFGRVRSLSDQALLTYLASDQARRSTQLSLVASVASGYLTWRADQELLTLALDTLAADERSLRLTRNQRRAGTVSALDQIQARTSVDSTRAAVARYKRRVAEDLNQLTLLVGAPVADDVAVLALADEQIAEMPAGLPSDLLQRRPDIIQAEYRLRAANANIGAARAAFFPSINLTANAGSSSRELDGLFGAGSGSWLFQPQISLPIFTAGALRASLDYAQLQKDIQVAEYEKAIQNAFQEVADGLAARATYQRQLQAQRELVAASQRYYTLAENRYRTGLDSSLVFLDAQRSLFSAQQGLISDRLAQLVAQVNLYAALGGGWQDAESASTQR